MITTNDFNLKLEQLKVDQQFETYLETLSYFLEYETDQEPERIAKYLNKKIIEEIYKEANGSGLLKDQEAIIELI